MSFYLVSQPGDDDRFGDFLKDFLSGKRGNFGFFAAAIAFVKRAGVRQIQQELQQFFARGGRARIAVGVDHRITTFEGLQALLKLVGTNGEIWIFHNENPAATFHPKTYLLEGEGNAVLLVGSSNLTEGGLFTNYETSLVLELDLARQDDKNILETARNFVDNLCNPTSGLAVRLQDETLEQLREQGLIASESRGAVEVEEGGEGKEVQAADTEQPQQPLFRRIAVPPPPQRPAMPEYPPEPVPVAAPPGRQGFVMTLQRTDVGVGQTTRGTQRRSPEIFVPLAARDADPNFWGWRGQFTEDAARPGKYDRTGVVMRMGSSNIDVDVNMMTWPVKHDFRLRSESLRSAGNIGDILRIERAQAGDPFDYTVWIVPQGSQDYGHYDALCTNLTRNSDRRWGYY